MKALQRAAPGLADRQRRLIRPLLSGKPEARTADLFRWSHRTSHGGVGLSEGNLSSTPGLGRSALAEPDLLERTRSRRPFRGLRTARTVRRGAQAGVSIGPILIARRGRSMRPTRSIVAASNSGCVKSACKPETSSRCTRRWAAAGKSICPRSARPRPNNGEDAAASRNFVSAAVGCGAQPAVSEC